MDAKQGIAKEEAVSEYYISKTMKALLADPSDLQPIRVQPILGGDGHLLYNVLSPSEVKHYIAECERVGFQELNWDQSTDSALSVTRLCSRFMTQNPELSELIFRRVSPHLPQTLSVASGARHAAPYTEGVWSVAGLNDKWRFCKYVTQGRFSAHTDGDYVQSADQRSLLTLMVYLNAQPAFTGGATNFLDEDAWVKERASRVTESVPITEPGMCIVFNHFRLHEGAALLSGVKYIMRTDVLYRRQEGTATALTGEDEAKRLVQLADDLERSGRQTEAAEAYRRAFRLSKTLAAQFGFK